ncbi:MAG: RHS repeat-associated core domain-containing protein, partial [Bacteroidales bacterium]
MTPEGYGSWTYGGGKAYYSEDVLRKYSYRYTYDKKGRLIKKMLPGMDSILYVYDLRDRLVLTQDGNLRNENKWAFIKYDELDRPVISGIVTKNYTRDVMQDTVDQYTGSSLFEERSTGGIHDYTNRSYPDITSAMVYTVNYYDDYEFINNFDQDTLFDYHQLTEDYATAPDYRVLGRATGGKVKMIGEEYWLKSTIYYDKYGRVISTIRDLYPDGYEISNLKYKFSGQVDKTTLMHTPDDLDITMITQRYEYDHQGRLLEHYHQIDSQDEVLLQGLAYNELGQVIEKNLYCPDSTEFLQSLDFAYNIRGWLKSINEGPPTGDDKDLFILELQYENPEDFNSDTLYNGMISAMKWWQEHNVGISAYGFQYDDLYQLKKADYYLKDGSWSDSEDYNVDNLTYSKNGNLVTVSRYGHDGIIDSLDYSYDGNRLKAVGDLAADDSGRGDFYDGTNGYSGTEYTYDSNGNMLTDDNKGISSITYNFLNLPESIDFGGGDKIRYTYDATGTRWKTVIDDNGSATDSTGYMGGFVYHNNTLSFVHTATGRMVPEGSDYRYDHFIKDHLGSIRMVFTDLNDDHDADLLQETHFYPFGLEMGDKSYLSGLDNSYLYTGKSIDEAHGLDWYFHGARYFDPQLALWHSPDPLPESTTSLSPY